MYRVFWEKHEDATSEEFTVEMGRQMVPKISKGGVEQHKHQMTHTDYKTRTDNYAEGHNFWGSHTSLRVWLWKLEGMVLTESQRLIWGWVVNRLICRGTVAASYGERLAGEEAYASRPAPWGGQALVWREKTWLGRSHWAQTGSTWQEVMDMQGGQFWGGSGESGTQIPPSRPQRPWEFGRGSNSTERPLEGKGG